MAWVDDEDMAAAAAAAIALPTPIDVYYDEDDHDDEVRRRSFTSSFESIDRVGFEMEFLPVRRHRPETLPTFRHYSHTIAPSEGPTDHFRRALQRPFLRQDATITAMPTRATTAEEVKARRLVLLAQLEGLGVSPLVARDFIQQSRREGVAPCAACYDVFVTILVKHQTPVEDLLDVLDEMRCDAVTPKKHTVQLVVREACASVTTVALAASLLLDHGAMTDAALRDTVAAAVTQFVLEMTADAAPDLTRDTSVLPPRLSRKAFLALFVDRRGASPSPMEVLANLSALIVHGHGPEDVNAAVTLFRSSFADSLRRLSAQSLHHRVATNIVTWLLQSLHAVDGNALLDRPALRLAIVSIATDLKLPIPGPGYVSIFNGCAAEGDVRGVVFFLHMKTHHIWSSAATVAAADFLLSSKSYDKDVQQLAHKSKSAALWEHVEHMIATPPPAGEATLGFVLAAAARVAAADGNVALALDIFERAASPSTPLQIEPSEQRRVLQSIAHAINNCSAAIPMECVDRMKSLRVDVWNTFLKGLRTSAECIAKLESSPASIAATTVAVDTPLPASVVQQIVGNRSDAYVMIVDSGAWAALATDPNAAATVAKQLAAYEKSCGGVLLVGMETVLSSLDDLAFTTEGTKAQRASIALLLAEWLRVGSSWLRVLPLEYALVARGAVPKSALPPPAEWPAAWWASRVREGGYSKVMLITGREAERDALVQQGHKPVVTVAELVKKLSGAKS